MRNRRTAGLSAEFQLDLNSIMPRTLTLFAAVAMLAGCATAPPPNLAASRPGSPEAPEGAPVARQTSLRPDEATRKSHALLSAAQKEQEKWDAYGPVSGTPEDAPKTDAKPKIKHAHQ